MPSGLIAMPQGVYVSNIYCDCVVIVLGRCVDHIDGSQARICHIGARPIGRYCHSNRACGEAQEG